MQAFDGSFEVEVEVTHRANVAELAIFGYDRQLLLVMEMFVEA